MQSARHQTGLRDFCLARICVLSDMFNVSLVRADMRGACLRGALLINADMSGVDVREGMIASAKAKRLFRG